MNSQKLKQKLINFSINTIQLRLLGERGREANSGFVGMSSFGASAPANTLFEHYGITSEQVVKLAKSKI